MLGGGAVVTVVGLPIGSPGVGELLGALGGVLPFGFRGEAFTGPGGIGASVLEANVSDRVIEL